MSQLLPACIILLSGYIIDQYDRKKLIIISNLLKLLLFFIIIWNHNIWIIYIVTFLFNFIFEFECNTFQSMLMDVFQSNQLLKVSSTINVLDSASMIIAPVTASFLTVSFSFRANLIFASICITFAAIFYHLLNVKKNIIKEQKKTIKGWNGYFYIFKNQNIARMILFWNIFMLCIGITSPLEISMIEETLGMSSTYYGIGNSVEGIGMLVASVFILGLIKKLYPGTIIALGLFCSSLSYLIIGLSGNIFIYFIGAAFVGITSTCCPLGFKTEIQLNIDPIIMGRAFTTARFTVILSRIAGSALTGLALRVINIRFIYFIVFGILAVSSFIYLKWTRTVKMES